MKAVVYEGAKSISINDVPEPEIKPGFTKIKVAYAGICGGDIGIYNGIHPRAKAPLVMGHECSGVIDGGHPKLPPGTEVTVNPLITCGVCFPCLSGDKHVCQTLGLYGIDADGAMAGYMLVPNGSVVPLPPGMDLKTGSLAELIAVVVHSIRDGGYTPGSNALIIGAGPVGLALALALKSFGCVSPIVVEVNDSRRSFAMNMGFDVLDPKNDDIVSEVKNRTLGRGADFVFDCAGHQSAADLLPKVVKIRGTIVIVAMYKKNPEFDMRMGMFTEFCIRFVRVYRDEDFVIAAQLLQHNPDFKKLITHELKPAEAQTGFDHMLNPDTSALKILLEF